MSVSIPQGFGTSGLGLGDDRQVARKAVKSYGDAIDYNFYGVQADVKEGPKTLHDWNFDGLAIKQAEFKAVYQAHLKDKKSPGYKNQLKAVMQAIKTLSAGDTDTLVFNPEIIQPNLIDTYRRATPAIAMVQKIPAVGKTVHVPTRDARTTPAWGDGGGGALTIVDQSFGEYTTDQAYLYNPGAVSNAAQKLTETVRNLLSTSRQKNMEDLMFYKEQVFFRGDVSGTSNVASAIDLSAEASSYSGILEKMEDASRLTDLAGARSYNLGDALDIIEKIEDNGGVTGVIFCDRGGFTKLRKDAASSSRIDPDTPKFGFSTREFNVDGVPVVWTPGLTNTANQRVMVGMDFRAVAEYPLLQPELVQAGQEVADRTAFFIRNYTTLGVQATDWMYGYVDGA